MVYRVGGWWRLWIVLSVVMGAVVYAGMFDPTPETLRWNEAVPTTVKVDYEKWRDDRLAGRKCTEKFVYPLHLSQLNRPETGEIIMWCTPKPDYWTPLGLALIPGAVLLLFGLAFAWIRAGFRRTPAPDLP